MPITRLAPSPTGALHLGNARTFLVNWAMARQQGWRVLLRIEDLDGPRIKADAAADAIDTLRWLGMDWDEGPSYQSRDPAPYHAALTRLAAQGAIYPCRCTRSEVLAASAPNEGDAELRYSGACRPAGPTPLEFVADPRVAWRVRTEDRTEVFDDGCVGRVSENPHRTVGDFLVATKAGVPSYQLAVAVDDARQGVDRIVRGVDLLSSTPRQSLLRGLLGLAPEPAHWHLPLVVGPDGRRLAKRHGDTRVGYYRGLGVPPERIVALVASWSGLPKQPRLSAAQFAQRFDIARLPPERVVFQEEHDAWLKAADAGS
ncbi:aminoacyl-tRNA ligase [Pirellulimonas nuda]|uniref:Aminoacyl-tRNA ligase n=1 Tax=Pirellulimonas nuda TaxID=2528009 RepID=A0A518DFQ4_9BACT|nr:tRNA glutamyl-Q(34) synthetase GluQRS [Pirellulimonas nuda]QDU90313.1 aminoacyl-tRNA ligase [Pirellulimonas nuda]